MKSMCAYLSGRGGKAFSGGTLVDFCDEIVLAYAARYPQAEIPPKIVEPINQPQGTAKPHQKNG